MRSALIATLIAFSAPIAAQACMEAPELTHSREIRLIDQGIQTFKRDNAVIVRVKALRDRADGAFKAHQLSRAWKDRRHALIMLGFKIGQAPLSEASKIPVAAAKPPIPGAVSAPPGCTGGATVWVSPAE